MNHVVVREVVAGDVPAVVALVTRVLAEFGLVFGVGAATDDQLHALPGSYREAGGRFWVAVDGDQLLGTCGVFPVAEGDLELRKMYVTAAGRGQGLGARLLDVALAFARSVGAKAVVLEIERGPQ